MKLIAEVGLVGLPNAGKSTLLRAISKARPKVAAYPFTTLAPELGIAELSDERRLVVADIPGLIEGAQNGAGLGHAFLRHIERTNLIIHLVDLFPLDGSDPLENYRVIRGELEAFSKKLAKKKEIIAVNKVDQVLPEEAEAAFKKFKSALPGKGRAKKLMMISGVSGQGVMELFQAAWDILNPVSD